LRRDPDGKVRFTGFYNPRHNPLLGAYVEFTRGLLDGFSPIAAGYLSFDRPLDPASLPATPADALAPDASVQLIDIDPSSPEYGARKLINVTFRAQDGQYVLANTLRFMPTLGFPLRPKTRYALIVTSAARGLDGGQAAPNGELRQVLGLEPASGARVRFADEVAPALDVVELAGVARQAIASFTVFTTSDPAAELATFADALKATVPPPTFNFREPWQRKSGPNFIEYVASFGPSPNFQQGKIPFAKIGDGGSFNYQDGEPTVVDTFEPRFSLTVPDCAMPEPGYPIVLNAHGTGGNYRTHITEGSAARLAEKCVASMGVDQIFHGARPGATSDPTQTQILFFNFENIEAARTNARQSALDEVQRTRLFTVTRATIPASIALAGKEIRFDPARVMFFGHSQGGLNGPLYLAVDGASKGGVLSGSGGTLAIALLEKTQPTPSVAALVRTVLLGLGPDDDELDVFHPAIALAQSIVDTVDPSNYARLILREPRPGNLPKSLLVTEGVGPDGVGDSYTPPRAIEAHALALGLPVMAPPVHPIAELEFGAGMVTIAAAGLRGNLAGGAATGVLAQWVPSGSDGHFVSFDVPAAAAQITGFLRSLADGSPGTIPAP
jgi:predicted esterase